MTVLQYKYESEPRLDWTARDVDELILWGTKTGMSDMILNSGDVVNLRVNGRWHRVTEKPIKNAELSIILADLTGNSAAMAIIAQGKDMDFGYEIKEDRLTKHRYRGNATPIIDGWQTGVSITLRTIPNQPPSLEDLRVEQELVDALFPANGLVLVTGVMGSGKSTFLGGTMRSAAERLHKHIATYESPIEFNLTDLEGKTGPVEQSEIPRHLKDFLRATRNSTRRAPDIVLIGESRDAETLRGMLESAEIGVAAYTTVHTRSVSATPIRIINVFDLNERAAMGASLIKSLRVIVQQRLFPKIGGGRIAAREFLVFSEDMREHLVNVPLNRLDSEVEKMVQAHGQPLERVTKKLMDDGLIAPEHYHAVRVEKSRKEER